MFKVQDKIQNCSLELDIWSRNTFGNITKELKHKTKLLQIAEEESIRGMNHVNVYFLKKKSMLCYPRKRACGVRGLAGVGSKAVTAIPGSSTKVPHNIVGEIPSQNFVIVKEPSTPQKMLLQACLRTILALFSNQATRQTLSR